MWPYCFRCTEPQFKHMEAIFNNLRSVLRILKCISIHIYVYTFIPLHFSHKCNGRWFHFSIYSHGPFFDPYYVAVHIVPKVFHCSPMLEAEYTISFTAAKKYCSLYFCTCGFVDICRYFWRTDSGVEILGQSYAQTQVIICLELKTYTRVGYKSNWKIWNEISGL